jgi:DNA polymerase-3 subunit gamma/tau
MTHVVLARKYRPKRFDQMVGQEHVVRALGNALQSGRLHHAYLFTGTRGIGKTTVSRILAKSLNCTGPDGTGGVTDQPCGVCQACTEIDADRYMDYIELDAASNRSIDEIRDLIERAAYKPGVGRYKVFMIDEAHQLTKDAFNALLKTLEEPPEYLKFVLATTDPDKMLPTVLSRCLQFNLRPMAPETVRDHLHQVLGAEAVAFDEGALRLLSRAARGSMRDALSLTDQAIAYGGGKLDEAGVRAMLGSVDRRHAAALVDALARRDGASVLATVGELRAQGLSAAGTLEEMAALLQQMAIQQAVPGALDETDPDTAATVALAAAMPADETQLLYSMVVQGRGELALVSDEYGALAMVLLRLLAFTPAGDEPPARPAPSSAPLRTPAPPARAVPLATAMEAKPPQPTPASAAPRVAAPHATAASAAAATRPMQPARAAEPPPWLDDVPPDDDAPGAGSAAVAAAPPVASTRAAVALQATALGDRWAEAVRPLLAPGGLSALARELAVQAELVAVQPGAQGETWRLRVERDTLRTAALKDKLQAALAAALTPAPELQLEAGTAVDSIALRDAAERARALKAAEETIQSDPVVREVLAQFRTARIVPGSIKAVDPAAAPSTDTRKPTP